MRLVLVGVIAVTLVGACSAKDGGGGSSTPRPCVVDTNEPNETFMTKTALGAIHDDGSIGTPSEPTPKEIDKIFSTHTATDIDWYELDIHDTGIGGNPAIHLLLDAGFEATAFWSCSSTTQAVVCDVGTKVTNDPDLATSLGCTTVQPATSGTPPQLSMNIECDGSDDSGRLFVRVKSLAPSDTCQSYRLHIYVD